MFQPDPRRPQGVLLDPSPNEPVGILSRAPIANTAPLEFPAAPPIVRPDASQASQLQQPLPTPPPSTKRATIWDKEHLAETLANIGQGFLSSQNFFDGLGNAAGAMAAGNRQLRKERDQSISYGGPDGRFEIAVDGLGNRTIREVPEFAAAADKARADRAAERNAPTDEEKADRRSRAIYAISKLPEAQRAVAYQDLIQNPTRYGVDPAGLPPAWSDQFGQVAGSMGLTVNQGLTQDRSERTFEHRVAQDGEEIELKREKLRKAPPSTRGGGGGAKPTKGYSSPQSKAEFDALPAGSKFIAPDGSKRIKQ